MTMTIQVQIRVWPEDGQFVAHAMPIDVASAGDSPQAARQAVAEAVELFVATAREQGVLDDVLQECGYRSDGESWIAPPILEEGSQLLAV